MEGISCIQKTVNEKRLINQKCAWIVGPIACDMHRYAIQAIQWIGPRIVNRRNQVEDVEGNIPFFAWQKCVGLRKQSAKKIIGGTVHIDIDDQCRRMLVYRVMGI